MILQKIFEGIAVNRSLIRIDKKLRGVVGGINLIGSLYYKEHGYLAGLSFRCHGNCLWEKVGSMND